MFRNISELVEQAGDGSISGVMLEAEAESTGKAKEEIISRMADQLQVMKRSAREGLQGLRARSGLCGGDALLLDRYIQKGSRLTGGAFPRAVNYAVAVNEANAHMGIICASPTAGACGVLPGVLLAAQEHLGKSDEAITMALFCAGAVGLVIANNACISGAQGGCQAEVGSAAAMAAAAVTELAGGTAEQAANAAAIALKNMLGLPCDPLAGLVEVPCIKRNAGGAANAMAAAEMALAGIKSMVPCDEVIETMYRIGINMSPSLRETAQGGLAGTPTGRRWKSLLWENESPQPQP